MTERLRDGMRTALSSGELPWTRTLVVLPGTESRSRPEVLRPDGRTDISILWIEIFLRFGEHDPHAIIECKRIAGADSGLCREYVVEGIDRFRTGKYAANHATEDSWPGISSPATQPAAVQGINQVLELTARATATSAASERETGPVESGGGALGLGKPPPSTNVPRASNRWSSIMSSCPHWRTW